MWLTLLMDIRAWLVATLIATGLYATVQHLEKEAVKTEFAQFRADTESEAAKAKVAAAQEASRQAQNAEGVISDLQTRYVALNARYRVLRDNDGSGPVPALSTAAASLGSCPDGGDAATRLLAEIESRVTAITETGDKEIAKYRELWELQLRNSGSAI